MIIIQKNTDNLKPSVSFASSRGGGEELTMHVLVLGSGGREHGLCRALAESKGENRVSCGPGNAGTAKIGTNIDLNPGEHDRLLEVCKEEGVDLVVVGPEDPLVAGIADVLREAGIPVLGPGGQAAQLEGSKIFAKQFCDRHSIQTAAFKIFDDADKAHKYIDKRSEEECIVKADGLAAGKGVIVCDDKFDAHAGVDTCFVDRKFGSAGDRIIIEERLAGFETTLLTLVSGSQYMKFPYSQDHKRAYDGDKGPNTGGMGVFAPTPKVTAELDEWITMNIVEPTIEGLVDDGIDYIGCLYFGLMVTEEGPAVLEFNVRFGDPETQAILPLMEGNFLEAVDGCANGNLENVKLTQSKKKALTVILASKGYPGKYSKGIDITEDIRALEENKNVIVVHAGTRQSDGKILTSGGRVVAVTALGSDFSECREIVYSAIDERELKDLFYRKDIGHELVPA